MARYLVLQRSFINNGLVEEGETVEYAGKPGSNLKRVESASADAPAKAVKPALSK